MTEVVQADTGLDTMRRLDPENADKYWPSIQDAAIEALAPKLKGEDAAAYRNLKKLPDVDAALTVSQNIAAMRLGRLKDGG